MYQLDNNNSIRFPFEGPVAPKDQIKLFTNSIDGSLSDSMVAKINKSSNMALIPVSDEWLPSFKRLTGDSSLWSLADPDGLITIRPATGWIIRFHKALDFFNSYVITMFSKNQEISKSIKSRFPTSADSIILATNKGFHKSFVIDTETGRFLDASGFTDLYKCIIPKEYFKLWSESAFYSALSKQMRKWDSWALDNYSKKLGSIISLIIPTPDKGLYQYDDDLFNNSYKNLNGHQMTPGLIVTYKGKYYCLTYIGEIQDGKDIPIQINKDKTLLDVDDQVKKASGKFNKNDFMQMWNNGVENIPSITRSLPPEGEMTAADSARVQSNQKILQYNKSNTPILDWVQKMQEVKNK